MAIRTGLVGPAAIRSEYRHSNTFSRPYVSMREYAPNVFDEICEFIANETERLNKLKRATQTQ